MLQTDDEVFDNILVDRHRCIRLHDHNCPHKHTPLRILTGDHCRDRQVPNGRDGGDDGSEEDHRHRRILGDELRQCAVAAVHKRYVEVQNRDSIRHQVHGKLDRERLVRHVDYPK